MILNYIVSQKLYYIDFQLGKPAILIVNTIIIYSISSLITFSSEIMICIAKIGLLLICIFVLLLFAVSIISKEQVIMFIGNQNIINK